MTPEQAFGQPRANTKRCMAARNEPANAHVFEQARQ
jgi:hypothetical protein